MTNVSSDTEIHAIPLDRLLNRVLNLTDEFWRAKAAEGPMYFNRVEGGFKDLAKSVTEQEVVIGDHRLTIDQLSSILLSLRHAEVIAKRTDSFDAYTNVAEAVEPITNLGMLVDTQSRPD